MRLIDAYTLKNDLITFFPDECLEGITAKTLFKQILTDIDNAPTIETKECPYSCEKCAKKMICELGKEMNRPKGKWITENLEKPYGKCNQCGEICEVDNYCGNCGADMRGEENERTFNTTSYMS